MSLLPENPVPFDRPAIYEISVQGRIDPSWSELLEGMTIYVTTGERGTSVTVLEGEFSDQAALLGILNSLYELHMPVLMVVCRPFPLSDETSKQAGFTPPRTNQKNKD